MYEALLMQHLGIRPHVPPTPRTPPSPVTEHCGPQSDDHPGHLTTKIAPSQSAQPDDHQHGHWTDPHRRMSEDQRHLLDDHDELAAKSLVVSWYQERVQFDGGVLQDLGAVNATTIFSTLKIHQDLESEDSRQSLWWFLGDQERVQFEGGVLQDLANRDNPINNSSSGVVKIDHNGNLAIFDGNSSNPVWSTNISIPITEKTNSSTMFCKLLDSRNLVLFDGNEGDFLWQSFHYPTNIHLPGMKLGLSLKSGLNWSLTSWKSPDDPSTGEFSYSLTRMEAPALVLKKASQKVRRTGPWNGQAWNGVPDMSRNFLFNYSFVNNQDEIYFIFSMYNASIISFFVLNDQGIIKGPTWVEGDHRWNNLRDYPGDRCENYGKCGAFGSCNSNNAEICSCLPGYELRSPRDWYIADRSKGCARKRELLCGKGDGFLKLEKRKLPDTSNARVYMIEDCEVECRKNCSCTGYASAYVAGSGCLAWFGDLIDIAEFTVGVQDLFVRVDAIELSEYRGMLIDGLEIAVKRLSKNSGQGVNEFKNEVVLLAKLQHRNLVQILGCCVEEEEKMLIYEYMPNRSLDFLLFAAMNSLTALMLLCRFFAHQLCSSTDDTITQNKFLIYRAPTHNDTITQNKFLRDGDTIVSTGVIYALGFFSPAKSQNRYVTIWFNKVSEQTVIDDRGNLAIFHAN
ncbi:hypothetical protein Syun_027155 [Stephania yunnanensis]|uniref:non-specific serine/threonine protein kinase n=1 Tax=Stephania yunnanensis TaxID=152371 RepID=A0AAP0ENY2_9MAGN